jgi:hypothetical protein
MALTPVPWRRNYSEIRLLTAPRGPQKHIETMLTSLNNFSIPPIITIMVFYEPGVTSHNLPRDPFKVRAVGPNFNVRSHTTLVVRCSSTDRMDFDSVS